MLQKQYPVILKQQRSHLNNRSKIHYLNIHSSKKK